MTKPATRQSPPQLPEHLYPRRRNVYDYDDEYDPPIVQHWTAPSAHRGD
jgi:hypothetical protein